MKSDLLAYADQYSAAKRALGDALQVSDDLLHVHVGLAIFVVTALLLRRRISLAWPLAAVAVLAALNEAIDYFGSTPAPPLRVATDVLNTVLWPLVLFLLVRWGEGCGQGSDLTDDSNVLRARAQDHR